MLQNSLGLVFEKMRFISDQTKIKGVSYTIAILDMVLYDLHSCSLNTSSCLEL